MRIWLGLESSDPVANRGHLIPHVRRLRAQRRNRPGSLETLQSHQRKNMGFVFFPPMMFWRSYGRLGGHVPLAPKQKARMEKSLFTFVRENLFMKQLGDGGTVL